VKTKLSDTVGATTSRQQVRASITARHHVRQSAWRSERRPDSPLLVASGRVSVSGCCGGARAPDSWPPALHWRHALTTLRPDPVFLYRPPRKRAAPSSSSPKPAKAAKKGKKAAAAPAAAVCSPPALPGAVPSVLGSAS